MFSPCFQICTEQALAHRHHQKSADDSRKLRAGRRRVIADTADRRDQFLTRLHYATALQSPGGMYSYTTHYTTQQLCKALVVRILTPHITPRNSFTKPWWYVFLHHTLHHATALQSPGYMYSYGIWMQYAQPRAMSGIYAVDSGVGVACLCKHGRSVAKLCKKKKMRRRGKSAEGL